MFVTNGTLFVTPSMGDPHGVEIATTPRGLTTPVVPEVAVTVQGPLATVALCGELDLSVVPDLERAVGGLDLEPVTTLVVDFTNVDFADSSVMHWLGRVHDRALGCDCAMIVIVLRAGPVDRLFGLLRMDDEMTIARDGSGLNSS